MSVTYEYIWILLTGQLTHEIMAQEAYIDEYEVMFKDV